MKKPDEQLSPGVCLNRLEEIATSSEKPEIEEVLALYRQASSSLVESKFLLDCVNRALTSISFSDRSRDAHYVKATLIYLFETNRVSDFVPVLQAYQLAVRKALLREVESQFSLDYLADPGDHISLIEPHIPGFVDQVLLPLLEDEHIDFQPCDRDVKNSAWYALRSNIQSYLISQPEKYNLVIRYFYSKEEAVAFKKKNKKCDICQKKREDGSIVRYAYDHLDERIDTLMKKLRTAMVQAYHQSYRNDATFSHPKDVSAIKLLDEAINDTIEQGLLSGLFCVRYRHDINLDVKLELAVLNYQHGFGEILLSNIVAALVSRLEEGYDEKLFNALMQQFERPDCPDILLTKDILSVIVKQLMIIGNSEDVVKLCSKGLIASHDLLDGVDYMFLCEKADFRDALFTIAINYPDVLVRLCSTDALMRAFAVALVKYHDHEKISMLFEQHCANSFSDPKLVHQADVLHDEALAVYTYQKVALDLLAQKQFSKLAGWLMAPVSEAPHSPKLDTAFLQIASDNADLFAAVEGGEVVLNKQHELEAASYLSQAEVLYKEQSWVALANWLLAPFTDKDPCLSIKTAFKIFIRSHHESILNEEKLHQVIVCYQQQSGSQMPSPRRARRRDRSNSTLSAARSHLSLFSRTLSLKRGLPEPVISPPSDLSPWSGDAAGEAVEAVAQPLDPPSPRLLRQRSRTF